MFIQPFVSTDEPEKLRKTFDLDYWGTPTSKGFEYILKTDTSSNIRLAIEATSCKF